MEIQSLVIDTGQIELSLGSNDGGKEYVFARLPLHVEDYSEHSLYELRLISLNRVREAVDQAISRLEAHEQAEH
jgi:hypothetical protein